MKEEYKFNNNFNGKKKNQLNYKIEQLVIKIICII